MVNAPAPYGAQRPGPGEYSSQGVTAWSAPTAVWSNSGVAEGEPPGRERRPANQPSTLPERGLPGWAAVLVLLVLAAVGGVIDSISGSQARSGFNYGIVIASIIAILVVRRSAMFPVVIAPPIVYSLGSGGMLYIRSGGLHDRRVLFDGAANWLVYGFPAIAGATAAVLIIAGIRLIIRR